MFSETDFFYKSSKLHFQSYRLNSFAAAFHLQGGLVKAVYEFQTVVKKLLMNLTN